MITQARKEYLAKWRKKNRLKLRRYWVAWRRAHPENRERQKAWRERNPGKMAASRLKWAKANPGKTELAAARWAKKNRERLNELQRKRYSLNPYRVCEIQREWRRKNPEKTREIYRKWRRENNEAVRAQCQKRKATKLSLVHPGHDYAEEMKLHQEARRKTKTTGVMHHVDHVIPLAAGGWHHHANLQILPESVNARKNDNPFWECPGYKSWRDVPRELWPKKLVKAYENKS